jgi:hypothetical protein
MKMYVYCCITLYFLSCELQIIREDQLLLVLMDVQKGYLEGSTWAIPHGRDAHPMNIAFQRIVRLLERLNDDVKIMSIGPTVHWSPICE